MWLALVVAVIGFLAVIWPEGLMRAARVYRGNLPAERTEPIARAARVAGVLLLIASLLIALAEG